MRLVINMPYSELYLQPQDSETAILKLKDFLTFKSKVYNPQTGKNEFDPVCLLESADGHFRFRTGLLYRVRKVAQVVGISLEEFDLRKMPTTSLKLKEVTLRDYQQEPVQKMLKQDMGVLCSATGSGKTWMAAALIAGRAVPTLFMVHTKELLHQTKKVFEQALGTKVGIIGDGHMEILPITIATVQTLHNLISRFGKLDLGMDWGMVITDECHHIPASTFFEVSGEFTCRYVYGLSATPDRKDGADLMIEAGAGPITAQVTSSNLIQSDDLVRPYVRFMPMAVRTSYEKLPFFVILRKYIVHYTPRNEMIRDLTKEQVLAGRSVLIAVNQVKHAEILKGMIPDAVLMLGQNLSSERKIILAKLQSKEIRVIISTLLKEGVDVPSLDVVINASGGTDIRQLIGRALRTSEGKKSALFLDMIDNQHVILQKNSQKRMRSLEGEKEFVVVTA